MIPSSTLTRLVDGALVTVVTVTQIRRRDNPGPVYRRSIHLSLSAAQRAVERAHQRGLYAELMVCRLQPLGPAEHREAA